MAVTDKEYYLQHKQEIDVYRRNWRQTHKKYLADYARNYYKQNKEKIAIFYMNWKNKNKDKRAGYNKIYFKTDKGKNVSRANAHNRRLKLKGLTMAVIQSIYEENIIKYKTLTCELCQQPILFGGDHLEHFIPLSRGGTNNKENLGISHSYCNLRKGNKTLEEYKIWL